MSICVEHEYVIRGKEEYLKSALGELQKDENFTSYFDPTIEHYGNSNRICFENPETLIIEFALNTCEYVDPILYLTKTFPILVSLILTWENSTLEKITAFNGETITYSTVSIEEKGQDE